MDTCLTCHVKAGQYECECCGNPVCKSCVEFLNEERFLYAIHKPAIASKHRFCIQCFAEHVEPEIEKYEEILAKAKRVAYLPKTYRTFVPVLSQAEEPVRIENGEDKKVLILQLAYIAAAAGYNSLIKAETSSAKKHNHKYQKSVWSGQAIPANIDEARLDLEEYREEVWQRGF